MTANNIFKFVSIRPPILKTGRDSRFIKDDSERAVVEKLRKGFSKTHDLDGARLSLGAEMMDLPSYYSNDSDWESLRPWTSDAAAILQDLAESEDLRQFEAGAESLFRKALEADSLRAFLASKTFANLLSVLWPSYYATVLDPYPKAQDREEMVVWLQFFALLKLIDDARALKAAARQILSIRPAVPIEFYRLSDPNRSKLSPEAPRERPDPNREKIERMKEDLTALEAARNHLTSKYAAKIDAFQFHALERHAAPLDAAPRTAALRAAHAEVAGRREPGTKSLASSSFNGLSDAPWRPRPEDFEDAHLDAFLKAGLDPRVNNIPELIHGADQRIAELAASLAEGNASPTVMFAGRIPVTGRLR